MRWQRHLDVPPRCRDLSWARARGAGSAQHTQTSGGLCHRRSPPATSTPAKRVFQNGGTGDQHSPGRHRALLTPGYRAGPADSPGSLNVPDRHVHIWRCAGTSAGVGRFPPRSQALCEDSLLPFPFSHGPGAGRAQRHVVLCRQEPTAPRTLPGEHQQAGGARPRALTQSYP